MKKTHFTTETDEALAQALEKKREEVRAFRFSVAGSAARDVQSLRSNKKDIARILTERNKRTQSV